MDDTPGTAPGMQLGWDDGLLYWAGRLDEDRRRWTRSVLAGKPHKHGARCWCCGYHGRLRCAWLNVTSWRSRRRVRAASLPWRPHEIVPPAAEQEREVARQDAYPFGAGTP